MEKDLVSKLNRLYCLGFVISSLACAQEGTTSLSYTWDQPTGDFYATAQATLDYDSSYYYYVCVYLDLWQSSTDSSHVHRLECATTRTLSRTGIHRSIPASRSRLTSKAKTMSTWTTTPINSATGQTDIAGTPTRQTTSTASPTTPAAQCTIFRDRLVKALESRSFLSTNTPRCMLAITRSARATFTRPPAALRRTLR